MKKSTRTALAFAMSLALMASSVSAVFAANTNGDITDAAADSTVEIGSSVINPIFSVRVPTSLSFALDAYSIVDENSQFVMPDAVILNKSNVPVQVNVGFQVHTTSGATLMPSKTGISTTNSALTDKKIYMQADVKQIQTIGGTNVMPAVTTTKAAVGSTTFGAVALTTAAITITQPAICAVLAPAKYDRTTNPSTGEVTFRLKTTDAFTSQGALAFNFDGAMSVGSKWVNDDVKITTKFSFRSLTQEEKKNRVEDAADKINEQFGTLGVLDPDHWGKL